MRALASLKLSAAAIAALGVAVVLFQSAWAIAGPMVLLGVNLAAAMATHPAFRRNAPLAVFHLALAALALLAAAGQLMSLKGRVELTTGEAFAGELLERSEGPLHLARLARVAFVNEGFEIDYAPKLRRGETRNTVRWRDDAGVERRAVIGDQTPLVVHGYRFYTTPNKGFAPVFLWQPAGGPARRGSVHLPSFPAWQHAQAADWVPPGWSERLTFRLELDAALIDVERPWQLRLPASHRLEVELDGARHSLVPGAVVELKGAALRYEGLSTWMGYSVFSDWTLPWLLAAALTAALSLAWHFWRRFAWT